MKDKNRILRASLFIPMIMLLNACASQPREVTASRILVDNILSQNGGVRVPAKYRSKLEQPDVVRLAHPQYRLTLGEFYFSALGQDCRKLNVSNPTRNESYIVCASSSVDGKEREWYLMPRLESNQESQPIAL